MLQLPTSDGPPNYQFRASVKCPWQHPTVEAQDVGRWSRHGDRNGDVDLTSTYSIARSVRPGLHAGGCLVRTRVIDSVLRLQVGDPIHNASVPRRTLNAKATIASSSHLLLHSAFRLTKYYLIMALRPGFALYGLSRSTLCCRIALSTPLASYTTATTNGSILTQSRDRQTVTLPDGRLLGFSEYGSPDGKPLFYFHGYPASRRESAPISDLAQEKGIRIISVDRPGIGASTYQPDRTFRDWPQDVKVLADSLALKRFAVVGASGGGPYAIACALSLPSDRLSVAGVFAGAPSWEFGAKYVSTARRTLAYLAEHWPNFLIRMLEASVSASRWALRRQWVQGKINAWLTAVMKKAKENAGEKFEAPTAKELDELREQTSGPFFDHFENGAAGFARETQLLVRPWGFSFEDVKGRVQIYHGAKDTNAPPEMIEMMAEKMPNCDLQMFEDDNHYTMGRHMVDVMVKLVSEDENKRV
ncbi:alpha/beta hydrolase fold domain-containing protein [Sarocladium implicatum]|nr:alpha/beta hydrolase fold domain-containing protein [Sarocladium implicatum]